MTEEKDINVESLLERDDDNNGTILSIPTIIEIVPSITTENKEGNNYNHYKDEDDDEEEAVLKHNILDHSQERHVTIQVIENEIVAVNDDESVTSKPGTTISLFHHTIREDLLRVIKIGIAGEIIISIIVIIACNLLFSFAWNPPLITRDKMNVAILNLDTGGMIGSTVVGLANKHLSLGLNYNFNYIDSTTSIDSMKNMVNDGTYFGALVVNSDATNNLLAAIPTSSSVVYDPHSAMTFIYDQGRCGPSYTTAMLAMASTLAGGTKTIVSKSLMLTHGSDTISSYKETLIAAPVSFTSTNLHSAEYQGIQNAVGLAFMQIYLVILIHTIVVIKLYEELYNEKYKKSHITIAMVFNRVFGALILSLWPGIVLLCLGAGDILTGANFFNFWAYCWLSMATFGALTHHLYDLFGPGIGLGFGLILILLQLTSSGGLAPHEAMPDFFIVGKGLPLKAAVEGSKAILLGTRVDQLPLNTGILFGWLLGLSLFTVAAILDERLHDLEIAFRLHLFKDEDPIDELKSEMCQENLFSGEGWIRLKGLIFKSAFVEVALTIFMIILLFLMYGNSWNPLQYFQNCTIAILNLDDSTSLISAVLSSVLPKAGGLTGYNFNYEFLDPLTNTFASVHDDIQDRKYWGALVIQKGAAATLTAALNNPSAVYDNTKVATFILDQGRAGTYIYTALRIWAGGVVGGVSTYVSQALLLAEAAQNVTFNVLNVAVASNPVGITFNNLHPISIPGLDGVCAFGPVFIYFAMNAQVGIVLKTHVPFKELGVSYYSRLIAMCFHVCAGSILLAFWPTISVVWLGGELNASTFFTFWAFIWLGMTAFATMFMMSFHVLGEAFGAIVNIIVYTISVASGGGSIPHELQDPFFKIGLALPFYNIVAGLRTILFDTGTSLSLGANVGIQLIWVTVVFIIAWRLIMRRQLIDKVTNHLSSKGKSFYNKVHKDNQGHHNTGEHFVNEEAHDIDV